ncbi:N-acetylglucosaminyldiphosphodolichol N-acetylglucosaminyltransferase anchoring subunit ALG14 KNAG_0H01100 [Huiozyma naganishii CBS 8797]|uniref:UDP-N-acetylglucosamine transferase subunit ALG14 n=1 Tax=Huiozyma naganishii (strain ATCC MYA-139 / BCRC 22969 / CBS 8797 / KCTC 17520 / NBRC 10181 / NCYC 3082 / Yp74L-3) TaxID=1071383 RepID=J7RPC2_HUIN7|nr:hypothetical protein KNAG_0H01100 [Kazachstania naganishii CBS 8797]CCK71523.1 hypothetical protein KNAG_0H01100 [Kazachstania naganishii CBS 8797]
MDWAWVSVIVLLVAAVFSVRLALILPFCRRPTDEDETILGGVQSGKGAAKRRPLQLFVFLGSGGHTGEMLRLLDTYHEYLLDSRNTVHIGYSDLQSKQKFLKLADKYKCKNRLYEFKKAREVNSSALQSVKTVLTTLITSLSHVVQIKKAMMSKPHLVLLNGPGTCCIITLLFKLLDLLLLFTSSHIVYVESLARIQTLSLTGKILYFLADEFVVQWEELKLTKAPRAKYFGILV